MSTSTKAVPFFTNDISIAVHSATHEEHTNKNVTLEDFADGEPLRLETVIETGELIAYRSDGAFIQGPEVV